jgi:hypothetical protein
MDGEKGTVRLMLLAGLACVACCTLPLFAGLGLSAAVLGTWLQVGAAAAAGLALVAAVGWAIRSMVVSKEQGCGSSCRLDGSCCDARRAA